MRRMYRSRRAQASVSKPPDDLDLHSCLPVLVVSLVLTLASLLLLHCLVPDPHVLAAAGIVLLIGFAYVASKTRARGVQVVLP